jgi:protein ImuB
MSRLVDRLSAKVGAGNVYRLEPVQSLVPERMVRKVPALAAPTKATWPENLPRPTRLLDPPELVVAIALLPDHPPVQIVWRRVRHKVTQADGPERIAPGMVGWRQGRPVPGLLPAREPTEGGRYWVFRDAPAADGARWWLHGLFG